MIQRRVLTQKTLLEMGVEESVPSCLNPFFSSSTLAEAKEQELCHNSTWIPQWTVSHACIEVI